MDIAGLCENRQLQIYNEFFATMDNIIYQVLSDEQLSLFTTY